MGDHRRPRRTLLVQGEGDHGDQHDRDAEPLAGLGPAAEGDDPDEGSREWEVLYDKTREEVFRRRFRM